MFCQDMMPPDKRGHHRGAVLFLIGVGLCHLNNIAAIPIAVTVPYSDDGKAAGVQQLVHMCDDIG
jgi:hypothetical protein